jgi:hypothetical protein
MTPSGEGVTDQVVIALAQALRLSIGREDVPGVRDLLNGQLEGEPTGASAEPATSFEAAWK